MLHGLMWLPLLAVFIGLAWAGWNEYQKLETYKQWAAAYEKAKYDIYSVMGLQGETLTWGKPSRQGPFDLQTLSLRDTESIGVTVDGAEVDLTAPPLQSGRAFLALQQKDGATVTIPFTQVDLAMRWAIFLQQHGSIAERAKLQPE